MKKIMLTGDRPTGCLHIGHYVGSLKERVRIQNEETLDEMYIMIADAQALTDNFVNPQKVRDNVLEVALDYLSCGLDPNKVTFFIQSEISELTELTFYYMNLVTLSRVERNPTVKSELQNKNFTGIPLGFLTYPISQSSDITAFKANIIPVGEDQLPMLEQCREIVKTFNNIYGEILVSPQAYLPKNPLARRLKGLDGKTKMSKSLNNCIYLSDSRETLYKKVMSAYTDPLHIQINDPGHLENNIVFEYLDVFCKDEHFSKYLNNYSNLDELKQAYTRGGVGDVLIKKFLFNILDELLTPIREKREELSRHPEIVMKILEEGTRKAKLVAQKTLKEVKNAMKLNYFE